MAWQILGTVAAVALVVGLLVGRWWFVVVVVAAAGVHGGWILVTGQETADDTTGMLLAINAVYL